MTGALLATDLVNLEANGSWRSADLEAVLREHQIRRPSVTQLESSALRRWATRLRTVFESTDTELRCQAINALLVDGATGVYLTTHDGLRPHLHFTPDDDDVVGRVMAVTAGGLALFTVESDGRRLGICARSVCSVAFIDISRNGRRAYCSTRCGNSDAVQRHRDNSRSN